ncbi:kinase-like domain-containing protein [Phlyctochytrium arcticum]|nr:kinase-like domain-containing protein [Phlyctochytrium arcticum]
MSSPSDTEVLPSPTADSSSASVPESPSVSSQNSKGDEEGTIFLDRFVLQKPLGEGSYGKVKLAQDLTTRKMVALKIIQKSSLKKSSHVTRLKREVRIMRLLHHPIITRLHDVIETDKEIVLAMEYVEGGELFDYIVAHKRLKEKTARKLFRQIVSAVDYCHQSSIIHRDLKPENVLLDIDRNVKIIDFGFVKFYDRTDQLNTFCGSPFYASPEMILGKQYLGPEVDVWSMGVILFALLNGHLPFRDPNTTVLYKTISTGTYETRTQYMTAESADLIQKMLTVDPLKRATLEQIRNHPWVCDETSPHPPEALVPERPAQILDPDPAILAKFPMYGLETAIAEKALASNEHGAAWALYCLLAENDIWERNHFSPRASKSKLTSPNMTLTMPSRDGSMGTATLMVPGTNGSVKSREGLVGNQDSPVSPTTVSPQGTAQRRLSVLTLRNGSGHRQKWRQSCQDNGVKMPMTPPPVPTENPFDLAPPPQNEQKRRASSTEPSQQLPPVWTQSLDLPKEQVRRKSMTAAAAAAIKRPPYGSTHSNQVSPANDKHSTDSNGMLSPEPVAHSSAAALSLHYGGDRNCSGPTSPSGTHTPDETSARSGRWRPAIAETLSNALTRLRSGGTSRRNSAASATSAAAAAAAAARAARELDNVSPPSTLSRPSKAIIGASTTSTKSPREMSVEIERVLRANQVLFSQERYIFTCSKGTSGFEIEICSLQGTIMHAVELRRKRGSALSYQSICQTLVSQWKL